MKKTSSGFPRRSTRENISIDVGIYYYCRTDIDGSRKISFLEAQIGNPHMETCKNKKKFSSKIKIRIALDFYVHPQMTRGINNIGD